MLGLVAMTMFGGVTAFAHITDARFAEPDQGSHLVDPATGREVHDADPVIAQVAHTVFSNFTPGFALVTAMTALILFLAANTAFNGFPVLGSVLAQNRYLRASCTPAATGWPSATASSSSPPWPDC